MAGRRKPSSLLGLVLVASALLVARPGSAQFEGDLFDVRNARRPYVADEAFVGASQSSIAAPRRGFVGNAASGAWSAGEPWLLRALAQVTRDHGAEPPSGSDFGKSGGTVWTLFAGVTWNTAKDFDLVAELEYSPKSTTTSSGSVDVATAAAANGGASYDADVRATSWSFDARVGAQWRFAGLARRAAELAFYLHGYAYYSRQSIDAIVGPAGRTVGGGQLAAACAVALCPDFVARLISENEAGIGQLIFNPTLRQAFGATTQVKIDASYYVYTDDPANAGIYSLTAFGRTDVSFGSPVVDNPPRWQFKGKLYQDVGIVHIEPEIRYLIYTAGQGHNLSGGFNVFVALTERLKVAGAVRAQQEGASGSHLLGGNAALGIHYRL